MRARWISIFTILLMLFVAASPALAQDQGDESSQEQSGEEAEEGGEGQSDADAETGAGEEEQEAAATEEEGPPWTYQMARITLVLLLLLFAAFGLMYYRGVVVRSRGA